MFYRLGDELAGSASRAIPIRSEVPDGPRRDLLVWLAELRDVANLPTLAKIHTKSIEQGSPVSESAIRRLLSGESPNLGSAGSLAYALAGLDTRPVSSRPSLDWDAFDALLRSKLKAIADADSGREPAEEHGGTSADAGEGRGEVPVGGRGDIAKTAILGRLRGVLCAVVAATLCCVFVSLHAAPRRRWAE